MTHELAIHLQGPDLAQIAPLQAYLHSYHDHHYGPPLLAELPQTNQLFWRNLEPGTYLLELSYQHNQQPFSAHFFQLDLPDTSLIEVQHMPQGLQFLRMGFFDDLGEFVDMLIYEGERPWLALPVSQDACSLKLAAFLAQEAYLLDPLLFRQRLHALCPDLSVAYSAMQTLWPYQLRLLVTHLAKTTPEWKACLFQLVRNNLILMDDERCMEQLTEAIDLAQQQERVSFLLELMEWDVDRQTWVNYPQFLAELKGHGVMRS